MKRLKPGDPCPLCLSCLRLRFLWTFIMEPVKSKTVRLEEKMERLTTDTPNGNFEVMLNFVHEKDGWAHIYDEDGKEVNLITWALNHCHDRGCDDFQCKTLEEYDEALSSCMVDFMDCPIAMAYYFAGQAVHLRSRLKMYEDTGLEPKEVAQIKIALMGKALAEIKEFDEIPISRMIELAQAEKDGRLVVLPCKPGTDLFTHCHVRGANPIAHSYFYPPYIPTLGENAWLTREEAEAALKKREEYICTATIAPPLNDPLTLEELREMDGEPVWVHIAGSLRCLVDADGVWGLADADDSG